MWQRNIHGYIHSVAYVSYPHMDISMDISMDIHIHGKPVYLHSLFCSWLRKTRLFCNRVLIGRSGSSKDIDFGTNRKCVCDFLLIINSNFGTIYPIYLAPFMRYGDLLAKNCEFFLLHSHLTPTFGMNPFEFLDQLIIPKTRVLGLSVSEDFVIPACVVLTQC